MSLIRKYLLLGLVLSTGYYQPSYSQDPLDDANNILYLMDRPLEPLLFAKGNKKEVKFQVPSDYLPERYQPLAESLENRFGGPGDPDVLTINVPPQNIPDLEELKKLPREEMFSTFIPLHREMAGRLVQILVGMPTVKDFNIAAALTRDVLNPALWTYALSIALLHRNDTQMVDVPPLTALMPEKYFDGSIIRRVREDVNILQEGERIPIEIPRDYTATNVDVEHRVAYFREDMGLNLHHWTWHLVYPFGGGRQIVNKDRRGELFYYQHQQIIARYDFERLSNKLARVKALNNFQDPVEEGYFPKLNSLIASRVWPPRVANSKLRNVQRDEQELVFDIQDLERWRDRIYQAIHEGRVLNVRNQYVDLNGPQGINILGNLLEASELSENPTLYGNLHNLGHIAIAICHDPDHRHLETFSVMGDLATAMRDPAFYRFHKFVDDIFQQHKSTRPQYTVQELEYSGITVRSAEILSGDKRNELNTFWEKSDVDLSRGLDIAPRGSVFARITHLQHEPFTYRIQVENTGQPRKGTVRIFLAPKFDERGVPMLFRNQRLLFIELDKFVTNLRKGNNVIERNSLESSVTIPYERTFRRLDATKVVPDNPEFNYCGCGWPQHMLIPKGSPEGMKAELFVMVSNYADDKVEDEPPTSACQKSHSYCGILNRKYPDRRSMGYPFDRMPRNGASTLRLFITPNMQISDVMIRFTDRVQPRNGTNDESFTRKRRKSKP